MRGARSNSSGDGDDDGGGGVPHLLAALEQGTGAVLTQQRVEDKTSQRSRPLLRALCKYANSFVGCVRAGRTR